MGVPWWTTQPVPGQNGMLSENSVMSVADTEKRSEPKYAGYALLRRVLCAFFGPLSFY